MRYGGDAMNDEFSTDNGGCLKVAVAVVLFLLAVFFCGGGAALDDGGIASTNTNRTDMRALSDNELMSRNVVRILSPDTYIYYNSGDTSQVTSGDRNNVAPVQTGGGQCWVSSAQSWGPCPAGAPAGSAVP